MIIPAGHILKSGYVRTTDIVFPMTGATMAIASLEEPMRRASHIGSGTSYPLPVVKWIEGKPHLWDGRHRYIVALMTGREFMLVAWVEESMP